MNICAVAKIEKRLYLLKKTNIKGSKYNSTENTKVTYLLGAGASFNSIPIWDGQGDSMIDLANHIDGFITHRLNFKENEHCGILKDNDKIKKLISKLEFYGNKAKEFGTLDIYARNLYLLNKKRDLNDLKLHLSIYFDIWENFKINKSSGFGKITEKDNRSYDRIDKRYYSLLAVILEQTESNPLVNENIKFISWNYDLQLEMAYKSFMDKPEVQTLDSINDSFNFFNNEKLKNIIHLNGFRGAFDYENNLYPIIANNKPKTIGDYLVSFLDSESGFSSRGISYNKRIKYAWEDNSQTVKLANQVLEETDILVIIGYSFPSYNRKIDSQLLEAFEKFKNVKRKKIIYQNPSNNLELLESITNIKVEHYEDVKQFYIPQEFLFPKPAEEPYFG